MSAWKYKHITPKVIVDKLRLVDSRDLDELTSNNLQDLHIFLTKTAYEKELSAGPIQQSDSSTLEKALLQNFVRTCEDLIADSSRDVSFLISAVVMKFEVNNVKALLRAKLANLNSNEALKYIVPVGSFDEIKCRNIYDESKDVYDLVEQLSDFKFGLVLKTALSEFEETRDLLRLETALEKIVYSEIWRSTGKLWGLDKRIARTILGIEIDSINIKIILRCKMLGLRPNQILLYLMPLTEVLGETELKKAVELTNITVLIDYLLETAEFSMAQDYRYMLTDLKKEYEYSRSHSSLERILDQAPLKVSLRMLKRHTQFFNIGLVLAFLNLKWFEVRNLRAIIHGIEENVNPEDIKKLLVLPE